MEEGRERSWAGGKGGSLTPTDQRHALCSASLCISEQQKGQRAGTEEGVSLVLTWCTYRTLPGHVCLLVPS